MNKSTLEFIALKNIKIHEHISSDTLQATSAITYRLTRDNNLTKYGLLTFLKFHPLHVVKTRKIYKCFAGLRGYQLSKEILDRDTKIPIIIHNSSNFDLEDLSSIDPLLSILIYGLDDLAYEIDFLNVWKSVHPKSRKKLMPGLNNKSNLEKFLKCSRGGLSRKSKALISQLKIEIDKGDLS